MTDNNEIHKLAMQRFDQAYSFDENERTLCEEDLLFMLKQGHQWDDDTARVGQPKPQVDLIGQAVNQILGEYENNQVTIKVRPSNGGTKDLAKTFNGLINNITSYSNAQTAWDIGFKSLATSGFGAWRIVTSNKRGDPYNQEISIVPINDAVSDVWVDNNSKDDNGRDARWMFVVSDWSKEVFNEKYPDAIASSFKSGSLTSNGHSCHSGWADANTVRVGEYWVKEEIDVWYVKLSDDTIYELDKYEPVADELAANGITEVDRIKDKTDIVKMYRLTGSEILPADNGEDFQIFPGRHIPIILVYGYSGWASGSHFYRGVVRNAKDPQRIANTVMSQIQENAALAPIQPWLATAEMLEGHTTEWGRMNVDPTAVLLYNQIENSAVPAPIRNQAPPVQVGLFQQYNMMVEAVRSTTGMFAASLGDNPNAQSGLAITAQQRQGDRGTTPLFNSLVRGIQYTGDILLDIIPTIYSAARQIRILKDDQTTELVFVNKTVIDEQTGEEVILNDLSQGEYDLVASSGPSFASSQSEAANSMMKITEFNTDWAPLTGDLIAENLNFPAAETLKDRIRKQGLGLPIFEPTEEEASAIEELQKSQAAQEQDKLVLVQEQLTLELQKLSLDNEEQAIKIDGMEIDNNHKRVEIVKTRADTQKVLSDAASNKAKVGLPISAEEVEVRALSTELTGNALEISETAQMAQAQEIIPQGAQEQLTIEEAPIEEQPTGTFVLDEDSGFLVNIDTEEVVDPNTGEVIA